METFLLSTGLIALAEMGDKTQLLALVLAARFRKPIPILFGVLIATLLNHAIAGAAGAWLSTVIGAQHLRWILGFSFIGMALWMLVPDRHPEQQSCSPRFGVLVTTMVTFFLLEIGDKTQLATVALAARYDALLAVVAGTTLGMMIANVPAVLLGAAAANKLNLQAVRGAVAATFFVLGIAALAA